MAPLDTGSVTNVLRLAEAFGRGPEPDAAGFTTLGAHLRAVREHKGLSLIQVADVTRVRKIYLSAIEAGDLTPLPSRPFAVGYVRAYARALGLDGDAAAARFKDEHPEAAQPLRAPMGVALEQTSRRRVIYAGVAVLVVAVGLWNVAQRTLISNAPAGPAMPAFQTWPAPPVKGPIALGQPTPPPADQTTPEPYVTPGLGVPGIDANADKDAPPPAAAAASPAPAPAVFRPTGPVYGVPVQKGVATVLVSARKSASLVVRGAGGDIYFAREMSAGEAYRAPVGRGLTADVSDPSAFDLYMGGQLQGTLGEPQTPLDKAAADPAKAVAAPAKADVRPGGASPAGGAAQTAH